MGRIIKWLFVIALAGAGVAAFSYLGARTTAGKLLGPNPPLGDRSITFNFDGVPELNGQRAWVITYRSSRLPGVRSAQIYVSPKGTLLATRPPDLDARLEAWERSRMP